MTQTISHREQAIDTTKPTADIGIIDPMSLLTADHKTDTKSHKRSKLNDNLRYVWTKNPNLLRSYFEMRKDVLMKTVYHEDAVCEMDVMDMRSHMVLAVTDDNKVVGGARLCLNDPILETKLPSEHKSFSYKDQFPQLELEQKRYGDVSRFAFHEDYASDLYSLEIYHTIVEKCLNLGLDHVFIHAPLVNARRYRAAVNRKFGIPFEITDVSATHLVDNYRKDIEWLICIFHKKKEYLLTPQ